MKKTVISIMLILPFILIVIISIAGKIYDNKNYIPAEEIYFTKNGVKLSATDKIYIGMEQDIALTYVIKPDNATSKGVSFVSSKPEIISVNNGGVVSPKRGNETVIITMKLENLTASIQVEAIEFSLSFAQEELTLSLGENRSLGILTTPATYAPNITVVSSDESVVKVESNRTVTAVGEGSAVITAFTDDGLFRVECNITVSGELKVRFIRNGDDEYRIVSTNSFDLLTAVRCQTGVDVHDIAFEIKQSEGTVLNGTVLEFAERGAFAEVSVRYKNEPGCDTYKFAYINE